MRLINAIDLTIQLATCKAHLKGESEWIRGYKDGLTVAFDLLAKAPTIEAEPVKHGRWEKFAYGGNKCTACGRVHWYSEYEAIEPNYCPNCGAKMDLEGEG